MSERSGSGSNDQRFDTSWIDGRVNEAQSILDGDLPIVPPTPSDSLGEVRWFDSESQPEPQPVVTPAVASAPSQAAAVQTQARTSPQRTDAAAGVTTAEVERLSWRNLDPQANSGQSTPGFEKPANGSQQIGTAMNRKSTPSFVREWGPVVLVALVVAIVLRFFVVQAFEIPSGSMLPTLETGDRIVVNQLSYTFGDVSRGEVVVFERPPSMPAKPGDADYLVKRVIGLPGDELQLFEGDVWVNGERLVEPYVLEEASSRPLNVIIPGCVGGGSADLCVVPEGFVFVLGDNRFNSTDSRAAGPIDSDLIVGRATVRAWPLNALSWL